MAAACRPALPPPRAGTPTAHHRRAPAQRAPLTPAVQQGGGRTHGNAYAEGRAPVGPTEDKEFSYLAQAFVSPSGQYYVEIWHGPRVLRMDVANAQTARYYAKNGVSPSLAKSVYLSTLK